MYKRFIKRRDTGLLHLPNKILSYSDNTVMLLPRCETRSTLLHSVSQTLILIHEMHRACLCGRLQHTSASANHHETNQRCHVLNFPRSTTLTAWQVICGNAVHAQRSSTQYTHTHSSQPIKERGAYIHPYFSLSRSPHSPVLSTSLSLSLSFTH